MRNEKWEWEMRNEKWNEKWEWQMRMKIKLRKKSVVLLICHINA